MKTGLPENHGLSAASQATLLFYEASQPLLTDVQHAALAAGVARANSMLVVSPTSTGKTQIAVWAIANTLERGCNAVYLVTHRALAKQKFEELKTLLLSEHLHGDTSSLVLATGDSVEDVAAAVPADPLGARLLVATYEKYLALLSASGIPARQSQTLVCCDEVQLIGDATRGQTRNSFDAPSQRRLASVRWPIGRLAFKRRTRAGNLARRKPCSRDAPRKGTALRTLDGVRDLSREHQPRRRRSRARRIP